MPVEGFMFTLSVLTREAESITLQNTCSEDIQKAIIDLSNIQHRLSDILQHGKAASAAGETFAASAAGDTQHGKAASAAGDVPINDPAKAATSPDGLNSKPRKAMRSYVLPDRLNSKLMENAIRKHMHSAKINELLERLEEINATFQSLGVDTKDVQDGSEIAGLYLNKHMTPPKTMCSKKYMEFKNSCEEQIKKLQDMIASRSETIATLRKKADNTLLSAGCEQNDADMKMFMNELTGAIGIKTLERQVQEDEKSIANYVLSLNQHLHNIRPINFKRFRKQFEELFNERFQILAELRSLEAELVGIDE
jgi:hypothetical protein